MIDALEEGVKDDVIENYLVSEELNVHMQDMFKEYNESAEVQQLIESTVNESLANETKQLEEKRDDDISKAKETDVKTLDLIEELVLKLHKVYAEESRTYRSERYAKSYLTTRHLNDRILRPPTEEKGDLTATWSRLFTTDRNRYFNWNYERGYTFPNIEGQRIADSPMNPNHPADSDRERLHNKQDPMHKHHVQEIEETNGQYGKAPAPHQGQNAIQIEDAPQYGSAPGPHWGQNAIQIEDVPQYGSAPAPHWGQNEIQIEDAPQYGSASASRWGQNAIKIEDAPQYESAPEPHWGQNAIQIEDAPQYGSAPGPHWGQNAIQIEDVPQYGSAPGPHWGQNANAIQIEDAPQYESVPEPHWGQNAIQIEDAPQYESVPAPHWDKAQDEANNDIVPVTRIAPVHTIDIFFERWGSQIGHITPAPNSSNNKGRKLPPNAKGAKVLMETSGNPRKEEERGSFDISRIKEFSRSDEDLQENLPEKNPGINIEIKNRVLARFQKARQVIQAPDQGDSPKKTEKMEQIIEDYKEVKSDATTLWIPVSSPYN